jgi:acyl dehydratase
MLHILSEVHIGQEIGVSDWISVSQKEIDAFGRLTRNEARFHMDPDWARANGPYGGTVLYGFQSLAMLSHFIHEILAWPGDDPANLAVNYGFDKVRFIGPIPVGALFRCRIKLVSIERKSETNSICKLLATLEVEGEEQPALAAEWLTWWLIYHFPSVMGRNVAQA